MTRDDLMFRDGLLKDQRILVTGGGTGLGKVMAEAFLILGAEVFICGRRGSVLDATADELMELHGGKMVGLACDIRDADAIEETLDRIWANGGPLTGLVNNAAGNFVSRTQDLSMRGFDAISNIVFRGSFAMTLACGKRWIAEGIPASVLSILATWVWNGSAFTVPSAMSKAGVNVMSQSLAVEWADRGIRLNCIAPGTFPTEGMSARLRPTEGDGAFRDTADYPMGRVGRMPELANLAAFLMSRQAEYLTGQTIAIDGARYLATGGNFSSMRSWSDEQWAEARESIYATTAKDKAQRTV
ncbi:NAD(P)-dependent dehydrogenase, short-chain alcohol dehydrogenase family [Sphingomonas sp. OV641]|uniref:SDR family oxidoreductase n=1 Tax=Sphingomonas sp. OV641 TaxID=1881068 RepID=UPI0008D0989F|nr:SDR family oxidoreductase [Sphingomonas sp. OV641]SEI76017.1 NAD(P)-dependent dehydrogenase, short-chain alcohol dehydrogenase family [Sphingomonas sp. OV641]